MLTLLPLEDDHMATKTKTPDAAAPTFTLGRFSFAIERGVSIPQAAPKASTANPLPFPAWFDKMQHNDHFYVPHSYWTAPAADGGRGADEKAASKPGYARAKVRGSFNAWKGLDKAREHLDLTIANRKAGDDDGTFPEDGISVWLIDSKAAKAA